MAKIINEIVFSTDEDIIENASGEVTQLTDIWMRGNQPRPMRGGLYDIHIFGRTGRCNCGLVNEGYCNSCRVTVYSEEDYKAAYGYYSLDNAFITKDKMHSLLEKFKMIKFELPELTKNPLVNLWSLTFEIKDSAVEGLMDSIFGEVESDSKRVEHEVVDPKGKVKKLIIRELEDGDNLDYVGLNGLLLLSDYKFKGRSLDFIKPHVNTVMPIISPALRSMKYVQIGKKIKKDPPPINYEYKAVIYADKFVKSLKKNAEYSTVDLATMVYMINLIFNFHVAKSSMYGKSKESTFRSRVSSRLPSSMRWNAISYSGALLNEVYLPPSACYHALQSQIINYIVDTYKDKEFDAYKKYENMSPEAMEGLEKIVKESKVLLGRNPTIHRNNLTQFIPKLWKDNETPAIGVNPYICKMYNLDFDGDQLAVYFITDEEQKVLLGDSLRADNVWVYDKTHQPMYIPTSTTMYGLYSATKIVEVKESERKKYDKFESIEKDYNDNTLEFDEQVILLPNKLTTYGREKLTKILGVPVEGFIGLSPMTMKECTKIIAGLHDHPNRMQIIQDLRDFGNEIATIVGIPTLPLVDLYKGIGPEIDAVLKDEKLTEAVKMKKIMEIIPNSLSRELKKLPDTNMEVLMEGSRIEPETLKSLYTPFVRPGEEGGIKVGDSTIIEGLSQEEYLNAAKVQRNILEIKSSAVSREGFNRTQLALRSINLKYSKEEDTESGYIYLPEEVAKKDKRTIHPDAPKSQYPGLVPVYSIIPSEEDTLYRNQVSEYTDRITVDGARIGLAYADSMIETFYQAELKLKYGGLLNDFNHEDIYAVEGGKPEVHDDKIKVGKWTYILGKNILPDEKVLKGEELKAGDRVAINANLVNVAYRYAGLYTIFDFQVAGGKAEGVNNFITKKGISYAPKSGKISYDGGNVTIDGTVLGPVVNGTTYFFPEGYNVNYGDRICSLTLNLSALLKVCSKEYAAYLFYLELNRLGQMEWNTDLSEVMFKVLLSSNYSIKKALTKEKDFVTRQIYGATKSGMKNAVKENIDTETLETRIPLPDDNPLLKLMLRNATDNTDLTKDNFSKKSLRSS